MLVQLEHNQEIYQQIATLEEKAASLEADDYQGKMLIYRQRLALEEQLYDIKPIKLTEKPELESLSKNESDKKMV